MDLKKNKRVVAVVAVLLAAACFFPCSRMASVICYPFIVAQSYLIDPIKRNVTGGRTPYHELQNSYDDLMQQYLHLQASADFMRDAHDVIAFQERYDVSNYCVAQVLERHIGDDAHYFLLDKGSRDGILLDAVVVCKDVLVGKIVDVYPFYSRCMLVTDEQSKVGGYVADSDIAGIVQGANGGMLQLLHVSHLLNVSTGAFVISSGYGLIFPRGYGIGKIVAVEPDGLMLHIRCTPLIDFEQITHCAILMR